MADINKEQIKLMEPQVLDDTDEGGGQMTGVEVVSGSVNNLFPDISRLDRAYGRVSLRKAFLSIRTGDRATYYGSHAVIVEQAADPLVGMTFFSTEDWFDMRTDAQDRMEAYLTKGPQLMVALFSNHYSGTKSLLFITEVSQQAPDIGEVLVLVGDAGTSTEYEQYVRILDISSEVQTFIDEYGVSFEKQVISIEIGKSLEYDFVGSGAFKSSNYNNLASKVFNSVVADAANYFGVAKLAVEVSAGALALQADTIFQPLVPASQTSAPITDFGVGVPRSRWVSACVVPGTKVTVLRSWSLAPGQTMYLGEPIIPGSLVVDGVFTDDGAFGIRNMSNEVIGGINYETGVITIGSGGSGAAGTDDWEYEPAMVDAPISTSGTIGIELVNRGYTYVFACSSLPKPLTMRVYYMAGGKWYALQDVGNGRLASAASVDAEGNAVSVTDLGTGTINYDTGSVSLTLKYMPDIESTVMISWADDTDLFKVQETGTTQEVSARYSATIPMVHMINDTVEITVPTDTDFDIITDTGGHGDLFQNAVSVGFINYETGELYFEPDYCPAGEASFNVAWEEDITAPEDPNKREQHEWVANMPPLDGGNGLDYTIPASELPPAEDIVPGTFSFTLEGFKGQKDGYGNAPIEFRDAGNGQLYDNFADLKGTINYDTGAIHISNLNYEQPKRPTSYTYNHYNYTVGMSTGFGGGGTMVHMPIPVYAVEAEYKSPATATPMTFLFQSSANPADPPDPDGNNYQFTSVKKYYLGGDKDLDIQPGSLYFTWNGYHLSTNTNDQVFKALNPVTGVYTYCGTVNWGTGVVEIDDDATGDLQLTASGGKVLPNLERIGTMFVRTPGAPLVPGQFTVSALPQAGGDLYTGQGDLQGEIIGDYVRGVIDYNSGIAFMKFGIWVPDDAWAQSQLWYNVEDNDGAGNVWQPYFVTPDQVTMNCVVTSYMPLDADLLGLNPVRLPSDGRVPIFRDGDIILLHHSLQYTCNNPVTAGEVVTLPRQNLSLIEVYDSNGLFIPELDNYTVNLVAGTVTFADPLDLAAYTQPCVVLHRIEDLCLASDVQVTGHMAITAPIQHDYPAIETLVSSVLPSGDLQSRIYNQFFQDSWLGNWSDSREGAEPLAKYDVVNYPLITTNENAIRERFAAIFQTSSTIQLVGEHLGVIYTGGITADISPINPQTGNPYITIRHEGWGTGWSASDVFRFNLAGAGFPYWFCRTTLQGPATENSDKYVTQLRGDSA